MQDAAVVDKPKYVYNDRDRHGNTRIYFWRGKGHPKIRLKGDQSSPEWWEAYGAALRKRNLNWLTPNRSP